MPEHTVTMKARQAGKLTARVLEARDQVYRIHGDQAPEILKPWVDALKASHETTGKPMVKLALDSASNRIARGVSPVMPLAALAEVVCPREEVAHASR